jgi:hypothetical protein
MSSQITMISSTRSIRDRCLMGRCVWDAEVGGSISLTPTIDFTQAIIRAASSHGQSHHGQRLHDRLTHLP